MKNNKQSGYIVPLVIGIVAVIIIVGAYLVYKNENGKGEEADQVSGQFLTSTTTNSTSVQGATLYSTSTSTQLTPVITSINPSSGPIGTIIELKGNNLAGFEGELDAWIENSNGEKAFLSGIGSVPRADQTIRVQITGQLCKENLSYKGGSCSSYMTITPGTYKIYTYPWGNMSNMVQFTVTAPASQTTNTKPSITVVSPNGGEVWKAGNTYQVIWQSSNTSSQSASSVSVNLLLPSGTTCYLGSAPVSQEYFSVTPILGSCGGDPTHVIVASQQYKIILQIPLPSVPETSRDIVDSSDDYFTITN